MTKNDYEVGYRRPPAHGRFQKGRSGNPKGRPKGKKNFVTEVLDELHSTISVQEGGKSRKLPKQKVITKRLVHKALEGNEKAIFILFNMSMKMRDDAESRSSTSAELDPDDQKMFERFLARRVKGNIDER